MPSDRTDATALNRREIACGRRHLRTFVWEVRWSSMLLSSSVSGHRLGTLVWLATFWPEVDPHRRELIAHSDRPSCCLHSGAAFHRERVHRCSLRVARL